MSEPGTIGVLDNAPDTNVRNIRFRLENGLDVIGRTEEWVVALFKALTPEQQQRVIETVAGKQVAYETPGSYVLHAEPGHYGLTRK